ncbi:MAG: TIR domain-containing protein, partial [Eggerthellaceae bacterium]|nr:TIR domain-containing protein [Eggerthellaceae bacterium]
MHCPSCAKQLVEEAAFCPHCNQRIEGMDECTDYQYEAFISYRHLPIDRAAALKIQRAIEGYRIPKQLVGDEGKQRLGKCFRDEDELPTSSSLSEQIEGALKHSRFLVLICSKHTRESLWVQREVELFSSYHGRDRVLIALAEGEPDESFPELLLTLTRKDADGKLQEVAAEPLAADMRDLRRSKFEVEKLRLIAPIVGCNFDDLRQRAKLRRNRTIAAIASGIAAVSLAFGSVSTYQQIQIQENYRQIQVQQSESLARESTDLLAQGDRYQALQVALSALPESASSNDRPFVPAAQMALEQSLGIYPGTTDWTSCYSKYDVYRRADGEAAYDGNGLEASLANDSSIEVCETATGDLVCRIDALGAL